MGIQDREWYQAELRKKSQYKTRSTFQTGNEHDNSDAPIPATRAPKQTDAHWTIRLMFWVTVATITYMAVKHLR